MTIGSLVDRTAESVWSDRLDLDRVRHDVDVVLDRFLEDKARTAPDMCLPPLIDVLKEFLRDGKRLRPLFCYSGWVAAGGAPDAHAVVRVGAALELFHTFALIHDDVMDSSDLRRGRPTVHRVLAQWFAARGDRGAAARFGASTAILLGDLCFAWSDEVFNTTPLDEVRRQEANSLLHTMRSELIAGQYLDLAAEPHNPLRDAWRVVRLKTARYTVELPLRIGAVLGGADRRMLVACRAYGRPVGEAFQLRDDLLGVFGNPDVTGKPVLDDLREGKRTVLMALAWKHATSTQRELIAALHGKPDLDEAGAERLRRVIRATGADAHVERLITARAERALAALRAAPMPSGVRSALADLVTSATCRSR